MKGESVGLHAQVQLAADVALARVAHQRAGQQARLAQDLEAVADAHHQAAGVGKSPTACMMGAKRAIAPVRR